MELGQWEEAAVRLIAGLDREPGDPGLAEAVVRLLAAHPQPDVLRSWLQQELEKPDHGGAASVVVPLLTSSR
jgi:hypothetical protein